MLLQNVQDEFAELIQSPDENATLFSPSENISIYRNNILSNLIQTLQDIYKMIAILVGEEFFRDTAKKYIHQYPSLSGNLHDYGEYFSDFLAEYAPVNHLPYLAEVAAFEWASHMLHFASDASSLDIKLLESVTPDQVHQLHFTLHPASSLIRFHYPILRIIDLCKGEIDEDINIDEGGINLLLIRRELEMMLVPLSHAEFTFLCALNNNETLGKAMDETILSYPDFKLEEHLPLWIQDKTIVDFSVNTESQPAK